MKKNLIIILTAVALLSFSAHRHQISYVMPFVVTSIDTLQKGLCVRMESVGNWRPLKQFPKSVGDTLMVYKIAGK